LPNALSAQTPCATVAQPVLDQAAGALWCKRWISLCPLRKMIKKSILSGSSTTNYKRFTALPLYRFTALPLDRLPVNFLALPNFRHERGITCLIP
jgi:hypothetical protein